MKMSVLGRHIACFFGTFPHIFVDVCLYCVTEHYLIKTVKYKVQIFVFFHVL